MHPSLLYFQFIYLMIKLFQFVNTILMLLSLEIVDLNHILINFLSYINTLHLKISRGKFLKLYKFNSNEQNMKPFITYLYLF